MRRGIAEKLAGVVGWVTAAAIVVSGLGSCIFFFRILQEQAIRDESQKLSQAAARIRAIQEEAVYLSQAVAIDPTIQGYLSRPAPEETFHRLVMYRNIAGALALYLSARPHFQIHIVTGEAVYSSSEILIDEDPAQEQWYLDFVARGENAGFVGPHTAYLPETRDYGQVLSYVTGFFDMQTGRRRLGNIVIQIDYERIREAVALESPVLQAYALVDSEGAAILSGGGFRRDKASLLLVDESLPWGWRLESEISQWELARQLWYVPLFFGLVFLVTLVGLVAFLRAFIRRRLEPVARLTQAAVEVGRGNLDCMVEVASGDELEALSDTFNAMVQDLGRYIRQTIELEKTAREMEMERLLLQINPHFIYNTLNSIVYMAKRSGDEDIVRFSQAFIALLQNTLHTGGNGMFLPLGEELKNIRNYLVLQGYRYPDRFDVVYEVDEQCLGCQIPAVLLQPLVENAIFHGIGKKQGRGTVRISAAFTDDGRGLSLAVSDDGPGMEPERARQLLQTERRVFDGMRRIGITNVVQRIRFIYGEEYGVTICSQVGEGTRVSAVIPTQREADGEIKL